MILIKILTAIATAQSPIIILAQAPDYPAAARASREEGDVLVNLDIDPSGALICRISDLQSQSLASLRRPSCALIAGRWPFGLKGNKIDGASSTHLAIIVRWKLERDLRDTSDFDGATPVAKDRWLSNGGYPFDAIHYNHQGNVGLRFEINTSGRVKDCVVTIPTPFKELNSFACLTITDHARFLPAVDTAGLPRRAVAHMVFRFVLPRF